MHLLQGPLYTSLIEQIMQLSQGGSVLFVTFLSLILLKCLRSQGTEVIYLFYFFGLGPEALGHPETDTGWICRFNGNVL